MWGEHVGRVSGAIRYLCGASMWGEHVVRYDIYVRRRHNSHVRHDIQDEAICRRYRWAGQYNLSFYSYLKSMKSILPLIS